MSVDNLSVLQPHKKDVKEVDKVRSYVMGVFQDPNANSRIPIPNKLRCNSKSFLKYEDQMESIISDLKLSSSRAALHGEKTSKSVTSKCFINPSLGYTMKLDPSC